MMIKKQLAMSLIALALVACDYDDDDDYIPNFNIGSPGISQVAPSVAMGMIEQVDPINQKIKLNGRWYQIGQVSYANKPLSFEQLQQDMQVKVKSSLIKNIENAADLTIEPTFSGEITNIDPTNKSFYVNGIPLNFAKLSSDIKDNDWVMISTQASKDGGYQVTSVVKVISDAFIGFAEIEGRISQLDLNNQSFLIGSTQINYDNSTFIEHGKDLQDGLWVEVDGAMQVKELQARKIEVESYDLFDDFFGDMEVEGIITWVANDQSEFELNHRGRFTVNQQTFFEHGSKRMLTIGRPVEVTLHRLNGQQRLRKVEFENDFGDFVEDWLGFEFECQGIASNFNGTSFTIGCGFPSSPTTIYLDAYTQFDGVFPGHINGQYIDVEGVIINQKRIAREIENGFD